MVWILSSSVCEFIVDSIWTITALSNIFEVTCGFGKVSPISSKTSFRWQMWLEQLEITFHIDICLFRVLDKVPWQRMDDLFCVQRTFLQQTVGRWQGTFVIERRVYDIHREPSRIVDLIRAQYPLNEHRNLWSIGQKVYYPDWCDDLKYTIQIQ